MLNNNYNNKPKAYKYSIFNKVKLPNLTTNG